MNITPLEIRQKSFEKKLRGYDKDEVNAFLNGLSQEWERLNAENKELKTKLVNAERDVQRLREVEASLFKTLKTAEDTGANLIDQAHKTAELHVREAQMQSEAIYNDAQNTAKDLIESAEHQAREIVINAQEEVRDLQNEFKMIQSQREDLLLQIRSIANETLERVEKLGGRSSSFTQLNTPSNQSINKPYNQPVSDLSEKYEFKPIETSILDSKPAEKENTTPPVESINTLKTTPAPEAVESKIEAPTEAPQEEAPKYYEDGENGNKKLGSTEFTPMNELIEEIDNDDSAINPLPTYAEKASQKEKEQQTAAVDIEESTTDVETPSTQSTSIEWQVGEIKNAETAETPENTSTTETSNEQKDSSTTDESTDKSENDSSNQGSFFDSL